MYNTPTVNMTKPVIASIGNFDGVHRGHRHLLASMRELAAMTDATVTAVTFTRHPLTIIRPERIPLTLTPIDLKTRLLYDAGADDVVALDFDHELRALTARQFMTLLRDRYGVSHIVTGYDNSFGSDRPHTLEEYLAATPTGVSLSRGSRLEIAGAPASSTRIRHALRDGDLTLVRELLGRDYSITGVVVHGRHIGHTIGFPTANVSVDPLTCLPRQGVYAAFVTLDADLAEDSTPHTGSLFPAMVNVGTAPTVTAILADGDTQLTVEAHIIGLDADIYGRRLTITFVKRLRDELHFPSIEALSAQLAEDRHATLQALS